jgi:hypothetical protein
VVGAEMGGKKGAWLEEKRKEWAGEACKGRSQVE